MIRVQKRWLTWQQLDLIQFCFIFRHEMRQALVGGCFSHGSPQWRIGDEINGKTEDEIGDKRRDEMRIYLESSSIQGLGLKAMAQSLN